MVLQFNDIAKGAKPQQFSFEQSYEASSVTYAIGLHDEHTFGTHQAKIVDIYRKTTGPALRLR